MKTIAKLLSVMFLVVGITLNTSVREEHHHEKKDTVQKRLKWLMHQKQLLTRLLLHPCQQVFQHCTRGTFHLVFN